MSSFELKDKTLCFSLHLKKIKYKLNNENRSSGRYRTCGQQNATGARRKKFSGDRINSSGF
jgi:hypothetical protein